MRLVDQWAAIERRLPPDWAEVSLTLTPELADELPRAAAALGPLNAGRVDGALVFTVGRSGGGEALRRLLGRLDEQRVWCSLERRDVVEAPPPATATPASVAATWDAALAELPGDWTELLCRLEIGSTDLLPRVALLCAPVNPTRERGATAFVFRVGRVGYGASTVMARRCFERLDEEAIRGAVSVLRVLSDTRPVASQGSSWIVGGRVL